MPRVQSGNRTQRTQSITRMSDGTSSAGIPASARSALWLAAWGLFCREWLRFVRQPQRVLATVGTPLFFWLILGAGLNESLNYRTFFLPGALVLVILFTTVFASISVIQDRTSGFLQGVLAAPAPRASIILGKVGAAAVQGCLQALLLLGFSMLGGASFAGVGVLGAALVVGVLLLCACAMGAFGFLFAWRTDSVQGFHAVMSFLLFPLWMLSGAFFPPPAEAGWMRLLMLLNPLSYPVQALRGVLYSTEISATEGLCATPCATGITAALALVCFCLALWVVQRER